MDYNEQFCVWQEQILKLKTSVENLRETAPKNVFGNFFLQVVDREFTHEMESSKILAKKIIGRAIELAAELEGSPRFKAACVLQHFIKTPVLQSVRLSDIRNCAVFEIYKQCGITIDTYFDRYSSPPGDAEENECYSHMAHGSALASAERTQNLSHILIFMQMLKRFFLVYDGVFDSATSYTCWNLNWLGAMWAAHIEEKNLGDLVWELFRDVYEYETQL